MNSVNISNINYDKLGQIGNNYSMTRTGLSTMELLLNYGNSELFFNIKYPGDNPNVIPKEGFEWRGNGTPESGNGGYYNPTTKQTLSPDLNHSEPIGPHWDYIPYKNRRGYRIFSNNSFEIKKSNFDIN